MMDHAVDIAAEADEQAELGDVADFAFDVVADLCSAVNSPTDFRCIASCRG